MSVRCSDCTTINPFYKQRCQVCYKHLHDPEWRCKSDTCQQLNPESSTKCLICGIQRPDNIKDTGPKATDKTGRKKKTDINGGKNHTNSSENNTNSKWNCCQCTFFNNADMAESNCCEMCAHDKGTCCDDVTGNKWKCETCDNLNLEIFTRCSNCSKKKKEETAAFKDRNEEKQSKDKDKIKKQTVDDGKQAKSDKTDQIWMCKICSSSNDNNKRKCGTCCHDRPRVIGFFDGRVAKTSGRHDIRQSIKSKQLRTIKTREVEREWRNIVSNCQQFQTNFVDQAFPPSDTSLFRNPRPEGSNVEWVRLKDVRDETGKGPINWKVYDKPMAEDISQGSIGNCWFICALAVVAERKKLIERIIVTEEFCPEGAYVVRLCKDGSWKTVVLDDYFPVDEYKRLRYSRARRGQLWVPLIEKAAAKIHGCYEALKAGRTVESLALLTGEPCEHLSLLENQDLSKTINDALIWSKLTHAKECGYLMCTSCGIPGGFSSEHCKQLGLITEHAYSLLDVFTLDTGERLLKLRNPWGRESWNGNWCDDSAKWHKVKPEVKAQLKPDGNANGIFWMEFKEFRMYFKDIDICKTRDWHETRVKGTFPSSPDGPWKLVKLYVPKTTDLCLGLHQNNKRGSGIEGEFLDICIVVFKILSNGKKKVVVHSNRDSKSYVGCDLERLEAGDYIIACMALKHLNEDMSLRQLDFVLSIHSSENIVVEEDDSVRAQNKHYLADTMIQVAIDNGIKKEWKKCEGSEEYPILSRPTQQPMCTPPIFNDLEKVEESINKAKSFMTDEEYRFWKNYLEEKRTEEINYEDKNWCLDELSRHVTMARAARIRCPSIPAPIIVQCDRVMPPDLRNNVNSYSLPWNGLIYVVENNDKEKYVSFQHDCTESMNVISSRVPPFTQDVIPPKYRQVLIVLSTENPRKGTNVRQNISYTSHTFRTLEAFGDKTRKHLPDIPPEFECLHLPRPIS